MKLAIWFHLIVITLVCIWINVQVRRRGVIKFYENPARIVAWVYLASALCSVFVTESYLPSFNFSAHADYVYLIFTGLIVVALLPLRHLRNYSIQGLEFRISSKVALCLWVASILAWFSVIYQLPFAVNSFQAGAVEVRYGLNVEGASRLPENFLTTIAVGVSSFYVLFAILFFVTLVAKQHWFLRVSMLVGSLSYVVSSLAFAARDGALFFILTAIFSYSLFKSALLPKQKRKILAWGGVFCLGAAAVLIIFTSQRFAHDGTARLLAGTVGYLGQQPYVFAETVEVQTHYYGLALRLPLLAPLIGQDPAAVLRTEVYEWTFGTFVKDYYAMYGWITAIGLTVLGTLIFGHFFRRKNKYPPLFTVALVAIYFQLMTSGVFYFRLGTRGGNLFLLIYIILLVVLANTQRRYRRGQ